MMAARTGRLLAVDISRVALERSRDRCRHLPNVSFAWCDISGELPTGQYDLIVCSEILYYLQDRYALHDFARRVSLLLRTGGHFVAAHASAVCDDQECSGFDFSAFGAKFIGETFARVQDLEFSCELRAPMYRIQKFRKIEGERRGSWGERGVSPQEVIEKDAAFEHSQLKIGGCVVTDSEARHCYRTHKIPILMYHRIAVDGPPDLAPYRVPPEIFERQMRLLQRHGYRVVSVDEASRSYGAEATANWPGRLVALTFDDGYRDFLEAAWPVLKRYGFSASVYLPTDFVGGAAEWDAGFGPPAPLMSWDEIRALSHEGVDFGAHSCSHRNLTELAEAEWVRELHQCRDLIQSATGNAVTSFCYPYGDENEGLRRAVAAAGYRRALAAGLNDGSRPFRAAQDRCSRGTNSLEQFLASLPPPQFAADAERMEYRRLRALKARSLYSG